MCTLCSMSDLKFAEITDYHSTFLTSSCMTHIWIYCIAAVTIACVLRRAQVLHKC